jgi:hypothetical protein
LVSWQFDFDLIGNPVVKIVDIRWFVNLFAVQRFSLTSCSGGQIIQFPEGQKKIYDKKGIIKDGTISC